VSKPVEFTGHNFVLRPPVGSDNIDSLPIFRNGTCTVSCWELTTDELAEVARTGRVFVSVFYGNTQPPIFVGSEASVREVTADYGTWRK
jgi:hypothetical protein